MNDWEDTFRSSRHIHNRVGGRAGKSKAGDKNHGGAFDVRKTFGTYEIKLGKGKQASSSTLEILRLTADGRGVIGDLRLEGQLAATVLMTGSRKVLTSIVDGLAESTELSSEAAGNENVMETKLTTPMALLIQEATGQKVPMLTRKANRTRSDNKAALRPLRKIASDLPSSGFDSKHMKIRPLKQYPRLATGTSSSLVTTVANSMAQLAVMHSAGTTRSCQAGRPSQGPSGIHLWYGTGKRSHNLIYKIHGEAE
ncbi:hypothetical protein PG990_000401 [Apiospora arundinis]